MNKSVLKRSGGAFLLALTIPIAAHAHHPMGGRTPETLWQGLASGLAHPVIEVDHLVFVLAAVVLAIVLDGGRARSPLTFVAASLAGTLAHVAGVALPMGELWVAISLLAVTAWLWLRGRAGLATGLTGFCALAGLVHGYAYGEAIVGAEPTPVMAYLVGLSLIQTAVVMGLLLLAQRTLVAWPSAWKRAQHLTLAASGLLGLYGVVAVLAR